MIENPAQQAHHAAAVVDDDTSTTNPSGLLERVSKLPYVTSTVSFLSDTYSAYGKQSSIGLVRDSVSYIEETVSSVYSEKAKPLIERHTDSLKQLDSFACTQWDLVEDKVSSTRTSIQIAQDAFVRNVNANAQRAEQTVLYPPKKLLEVADAVIDYVLPEQVTYADIAKENAVPAQDGVVEPLSAIAEEDGKRRPCLGDGVGEATTSIVTTGKTLSAKVKTRAANRVRADIRALSAHATNAAQQVVPVTTKYFNEALEQLHELAKEDDEDNARTASQNDSIADSTLLFFSPTKLRRRAYQQTRSSLRGLARPVARKCIVVIDGTTKTVETLAALIQELRKHSKDTFVTVYARTSAALDSAKDTITTSTLYIKFHRTATDLSKNEAVVAISEKLFDIITSLGISVPENIARYFPHHPDHTGAHTHADGDMPLPAPAHASTWSSHDDNADKTNEEEEEKSTDGVGDETLPATTGNSNDNENDNDGDSAAIPLSQDDSPTLAAEPRIKKKSTTRKKKKKGAAVEHPQHAGDVAEKNPPSIE